MLIQLLKFELLYHSKQKSIVIFSLLFFLFGFILSSSGSAPANVNFNSPYELLNSTGLLSINALFGIMFFVVIGVLRENQYQAEDSIFSTPVRKHHFFLSRFFGIFIFSLIAFSTFLPGFALGTLWPTLNPDRIAPFDLGNYLSVWYLVVVPNVLICTAVVFSIGLLTRNRMATYVSTVAVYTFYIFGSAALNSPIMSGSVGEGQLIATLIDPFGLVAILEQTQFWTAAEKNSLMVVFSGNLMLNRLIWISISITLLVLTYRLFSFRKVNQRVRKKRSSGKAAVEVIAYQPVAVQFERKNQLFALIHLVRLEVSQVLRSIPFLVLILLWVLAIVPVIYSKINGGGIYGESLYASTDLLISLFKDNLVLFSFLLITIYSGELVWRERNLNISHLVDSTPVPNFVLFLSKCIPLLFIPAIVIGSGILVSLVFQLFSGFYELNPSLYLSVFYFYGVGLYCYCLLALFVQSLVHNKFLGMGISALLYVFFVMTPLSAFIGMEHPLFRIGSFPIPFFSNMNGYVGVTAFNHHVLYWLGFYGILTLMAFRLWQRGNSSTLRLKLHQLLSNWSVSERSTLLIFLTFFLVGGTLIFLHTNVIREYIAQADRLDFMESYERKFSKYKNLNRLEPAAMKTWVDIYPEEVRYRVKADYLLKNRGEEAIDQLFITEQETLIEIDVENGILLEHDSTYGTYLFELNPPVLPKDEISFQYELEKQVIGYEVEKDIVENGTYISRHDSFEPVLGYVSSFEIDDPFERSKRNLPIRKKKKVLGDHLKVMDSKGAKVPFETILSTTQEQTAISSGNLIRSWKEGGRNYFQYKTSENAEPTGVYLSAKYEKDIHDYNGISIEQYYHSGHNYNISEIRESIQHALDYCIENFGPYPHNHLRIAEIPSHWGFGGAAHPGLISMVEDRLYLLDNRDKEAFDLVAKRTIHEVAHQWWGGILSPKYVEGGSLLTEGFTKYTEIVLLEKMHGKRTTWQLSQTANSMYFGGRAFAPEPEPPLYLSRGQTYLAYGKNYISMLALRDLIGEEKVNLVLRKLIDRFRYNDEIRATSLDFLNLLYEELDEAYHSMIDDWFKRVITYDLAVKNVSYERLENGQFKVKALFSVNRFEQNEDGLETSISVDEPIQIGVFTKHPKYTTDSSTLYLKPHQINSEEMSIEMIVEGQPRFIAIDPFGSRPDKNLKNNIREISN